MLVARISSREEGVVEEHPWINAARFNARRGIFSFFFFRVERKKFSLESCNRTRKLDPKGNDAIHFDASFQRSHAALSISLRSPSCFSLFFFSIFLSSFSFSSSFSLSSFSGILFQLFETYILLALTNIFFSLGEKRGRKRKGVEAMRLSKRHERN